MYAIRSYYDVCFYLFVDKLINAVTTDDDVMFVGGRNLPEALDRFSEVVEAVGEKAAYRHKIRFKFPGFFHEHLDRDVHAKICYLEAIAFEHVLEDILAKVVDVVFDGAQKHVPENFPVVSCRRHGRGQEFGSLSYNFV